MAWRSSLVLLLAITLPDSLHAASQISAATPAPAGTTTSPAKPAGTEAGAVAPGTPSAAAELRAGKAREAYRAASDFARAGDLAGARRVLTELAQAIGENDPLCDELEGTILALTKDYVGAEAAFTRQGKKQPNNYVPRFNRAEMFFLQARYGEAEDRFAEIEEMTGAKEPSVADLCRYKRLLCRLGVGDIARAEILVPPAKENDESPAVTFSRASLAYAKQEDYKAMKIIEDGRARFPIDVENLYTDSLVELRWGQKDDSGQFAFRPRLRAPAAR
jgi:hypothetical protein